MSYIGNLPFGKTLRTVTTVTANGSATVFYPDGGYDVNFVDVFVSGVRLTSGLDYTATDGASVTLLYTPTAGDVLDIVSYGLLELVSPVFPGPISVGSNVVINTSSISIGNSTVNTIITSNSVSIGGNLITSGNSSVEGLLKIVDSVSNTSSSIAASANSVTAAYTLAANAVSNATAYAATAYSNAVATAASDATTKAGTAYTNATSYADTKASAAYSNVFNGGTFSGAVTMQANLTANNVRLNGDLQIDGNLTVSGNTVTINVTNLNVEDNMIYLNSNSTVSYPDLGFAGNYNDGTYAHAGLFRDATDGVWKFFHGYTPEPDASAYIDTSNTSFALSNLQVNYLIGNVTGSAANISTAINVGANVNISTSQINIGNSTVNTVITSTALTKSSNTTTLGTAAYVVANGNVGVGTASPGASLDLLSGTNGMVARFKSTSNYGTIVADNSTSTGGGSFSARQNGTQYAVFAIDGAIQGNSSTDTGIFADGTGSSIKFYTNGSPTVKATIDSSGNFIAIGNKIIGINGTGVAAGTFAFRNSSGVQKSAIGSYYNIADEGNLEFINGTTTNMVLNSSGNLGVGVTPSTSTSNYRTLQIGGSAKFSIFGQRVGGACETLVGWNIYGGSNTTTVGTGYYYTNTGDAATLYTQTDNHRWWIAPSGTAGANVAFTQAMTLDSSGNLLLGATSGAGKLYIESTTASHIVLRNPSASSYTSLRLYNDVNSSVRALEIDYYGSSYSGGERAEIFATGAYPLLFGTSNTERMRLDTNGNISLGHNQANDTAYGKYFGTAHASGNRGAVLRFVLDDGSQAGMILYNVASSNPSYNSQYITFHTHQGGVSAGERARIDANGYFMVGTTTASASHLVKVTNSSVAGLIFTGTNSVANDGTLSATVGNGSILMVSENNTGDGALFFCGYKSATITLLSDPNNRYATSVTAGRICVTKSTNSSTVTITNKTGSTVSITFSKVSTSD